MVCHWHIGTHCGLLAQEAPSCSWLASCKAIVYSQFWQHGHLIEMYLKLHSVPLVVLRENMKTAEKSAALHTFKVGPCCHFRRYPGLLLPPYTKTHFVGWHDSIGQCLHIW